MGGEWIMSNKKAVKLTKAQLRELSYILYDYMNEKPANVPRAGKQVINNLIAMGAAVKAVDKVVPTHYGLFTYLENLRKDIILKNNEGDKIALYKKDEGGWTFVWFMTKGKTGAGYISFKDLVKNFYVIS